MCANQKALRHGTSWHLERKLCLCLAVEQTQAGLNWKASCVDPCSVSHKETHTAVPSEDRVGGSAIQGPVRDTRPLLPVLVNAAKKETMQTWGLSTAVLY